MTTEITAPAQPDIGTIRRNGYMAALALVERITSEANAIPTSAQVLVQPWAPRSPEVRFYFHDDREGLEEFTVQFGLDVAETVREDGSVYVQARRMFGDVVVAAWFLSAAGVAAVAA
ncbi:hypothetical protein ACFRKB_11180 [Streptomyces scopuliridis]|uniref:hypothetical protein n=1 Tax=Streptomyces scopuliridis TaxID=452529 RepID=UPI00367F4062